MIVFSDDRGLSATFRKNYDAALRFLPKPWKLF